MSTGLIKRGGPSQHIWVQILGIDGLFARAFPDSNCCPDQGNWSSANRIEVTHICLFRKMVGATERIL
jgi:hypothetical protein